MNASISSRLSAPPSRLTWIISTKRMGTLSGQCAALVLLLLDPLELRPEIALLAQSGRRRRRGLRRRRRGHARQHLVDEALGLEVLLRLSPCGNLSVPVVVRVEAG